jgi:hypothetical protein
MSLRRITLACLLTLTLTGCAAYTAARKQAWNLPNSPYYDKMARRLAAGEGVTVTYSAPIDRAHELALFILGAHNATGISERDHTIFAFIPDLREGTLDFPSTNALAVALTELTPTTVRVTALSGLFPLTGPMLSEKTFHRLFAQVLQQSPQAPPHPAP